MCCLYILSLQIIGVQKFTFFFSILKTENHIKKNHTHTQKIDHSYREENPSAESTTW